MTRKETDTGDEKTPMSVFVHIKEFRSEESLMDFDTLGTELVVQKNVPLPRYNETGIVRDAEQVMPGANDSYVSLCRKHFKMGIIKKSEG